MEFLRNEFFLVAITLGLYHLFKLLQRRVGWIVLNPILLTICALILFIRLTSIEYNDYQKAGEQIDFWLKPAVVALGVPLYLQLKNIRKQIIPILVSQLAGSIIGIISVVGISHLLGASKEVVISLASKSVTTPIAMEISQQIGGIPSLTAAVVVITGILGAMIGYKVLHVSLVKNPISQGLSMGTAAHAVGTSASMELSARFGAFSSLGLILNGILTAALTPYLLSWLGFL